MEREFLVQMISAGDLDLVLHSLTPTLTCMNLIIYMKNVSCFIIRISINGMIILAIGYLTIDVSSVRETCEIDISS